MSEGECSVGKESVAEVAASAASPQVTHEEISAAHM
jgi:hypothetical protein